MTIKTNKKGKFELNRTQKKHLKSLMWLFDDTENLGKKGNRQTGRSTLQAYVYLEIARKYQGRRFRIHDHTGVAESDRTLMDKIIELVVLDPARYAGIRVDRNFLWKEIK